MDSIVQQCTHSYLFINQPTNRTLSFKRSLLSTNNCHHVSMVCIYGSYRFSQPCRWMNEPLVLRAALTMRYSDCQTCSCKGDCNGCSCGACSVCDLLSLLAAGPPLTVCSSTRYLVSYTRRQDYQDLCVARWFSSRFVTTGRWVSSSKNEIFAPLNHLLKACDVMLVMLANSYQHRPSNSLSVFPM